MAVSYTHLDVYKRQQWHYPFENKERFDELFPADFINEGIDQDVYKRQD